MSITQAAARGHLRTVPRWPLVAMLGLALFINYIDRGNLATAAPLIKRDLNLSATDLGVLTSAFFWTYVPGQLVAGWLVDRLGGYVALGLGFALWSLATALTGLAGTFSILLGLRILLGIGESVAFPGMSKLFAEAVPPAELGFANALATSGLTFGPALGTLAGGFIIAAIGWRPMFLAFGGLALLWLLPWAAVARNAPTASQRQAGKPPPYRAILAKRALWGSTLGHFSEIYGLYFVLSWLPLWLVQQHGYSLTGMAKLGALVYCAAGVASASSGWACDALIARGHSINRVRKAVSVLGHSAAAAGLVGCAMTSGNALIASLFVSAIGLMQVAIWPIAQTLAGPRATGRWVGVQNCIANSAGVIGPIVTGWIVDRTGSFDLAFLVAAAVVLAGAIGWGAILPRVEAIDWEGAARP